MILKIFLPKKIAKKFAKIAKNCKKLQKMQKIAKIVVFCSKYC
jgi:hypothetical protein